ncbi:Vacuolar protein sorting-associated protein 55 [Sorochytrium milnesiophthora]
MAAGVKSASAATAAALLHGVIIGLAIFLATGFLLVFLSCALYGNWLPLLVVLTYILAPLPNYICDRCTRSDDILSDNTSSGLKDAGYFITSFLVVTGFALPISLARSAVLTTSAAIMSVVGGALVYGTIVVYLRVFSSRDESLF